LPCKNPWPGVVFGPQILRFKWIPSLLFVSYNNFLCSRLCITSSIWTSATSVFFLLKFVK
jgi:hypothetical protein